MTNRAEGIKWASKLQQVLGNDYNIDYDACDSGMTFCYYKNKLYKRVPNSKMCGNINVYDYKFRAV